METNPPTNDHDPPADGADHGEINPVSVVEHLRGCSGCRRLVGIDDVADYLGIPLATAYKWSARRYPVYPRTARLPNRQLVTRCVDVHLWLGERAS